MTPELLAQVMEATWPPAASRSLGAFRLRDGAGGGKRVSAASHLGADLPEPTELRAAEAAMEAPLFAIGEGEAAFDQMLAAQGYQIVDPVVAYAAPVSALCADLPRLSAFAHWPPLEIDREIWAAGGIGAERIAVMERVQGPHVVILARVANRAAGVVFVACEGGEAMLHAVEVCPGARRQGVGKNLLHAAANWAATQGAQRLSLVVTERNLAARALYSRLGMTVVGKYHYRALKG